MKAFALPKRLSVSTVFLVSIILTIVIANETYQKDCVNCVNTADEYAVKKRGVFRATCYGGKCPRRRSGKRGMKMNLAQFEKELQDFESTNTENIDTHPAEIRTIENEKNHQPLKSQKNL